MLGELLLLARRGRALLEVLDRRQGGGPAGEGEQEGRFGEANYGRHVEMGRRAIYGRRERAKFGGDERLALPIHSFSNRGQRPEGTCTTQLHLFSPTTRASLVSLFFAWSCTSVPSVALLLARARRQSQFSHSTKIRATGCLSSTRLRHHLERAAVKKAGFGAEVLCSLLVLSRLFVAKDEPSKRTIQVQVLR